MLVGSFNIHWLESMVKKKNVRELIVYKFLEFVSIHETKLSEVSDSLFDAL